MVTAQNNNAQLYKHNALTMLKLLYIRAEVSKYAQNSLHYSI